jgi:hypothetical protein
MDNGPTIFWHNHSCLQWLTPIPHHLARRSPLCNSGAWADESTRNEDHAQVRIPSIPHFWWLTGDHDDALATNGDTSSLSVHAPFHHTSTPNHLILNMINMGREPPG